jgi:ribonuclease P protein component
MPVEAGTPAGFPPRARLRKGSEYAQVFSKARRIGGLCFGLHALPHEADEARLGMAVSRKVDPRAVVRNRIKRRLRDTFRRLRSRLRPGDYVFSARPAAASATPEQLRTEIVRLLERAGALPPAGPAGTLAPPADPADAAPDISP